MALPPPTDLYLNQAFTVKFDLYESDGITLVSVVPDTVTMEFVDPTGASTVLTFGVDNELQEIVNPYRYRVNFDSLNIEGYWDWKFAAEWTSNLATAGDYVIEGTIHVQSNRAKTI